MKNRYRNKIAREIRVREAKERAEKFSALSPIDQLAALDARLGVGIGAKRQRARLAKKI